MSGIKLASRRLLLISVMALALALAAQAAVLAVPLYRNGGVVRAVRTVTEATSIRKT
jgi:hypothetical protein